MKHLEEKGLTNKKKYFSCSIQYQKDGRTKQQRQRRFEIPQTLFQSGTSGTRTNTTPTEVEPVKPKGDYNAVRNDVDEDIILGQILTIRYLHSIYGVGYYNSRYTGKVMPFTGRKESEIAIGTVNIDEFITFSDRNTLENTAKTFQATIH